MDQLQDFEAAYSNLVDVVQTKLTDITGCAVPCYYTEYRLVGKPTIVDLEHFGFQLSFAQSDAIEEKEALIYELVSFISEVGGALGLFLGLSFLNGWSILEVLMTFVVKKRNVVTRI